MLKISNTASVARTNVPHPRGENAADLRTGINQLEKNLSPKKVAEPMYGTDRRGEKE